MAKHSYSTCSAIFIVINDNDVGIMSSFVICVRITRYNVIMTEICRGCRGVSVAFRRYDIDP